MHSRGFSLANRTGPPITMSVLPYAIWYNWNGAFLSSIIRSYDIATWLNPPPFTSSSSYTCPASGPIILNRSWSCFQSTTGSPLYSNSFVICCTRATQLSNGYSSILSKFLSIFHWNMTLTRVGRNSGFGVAFFMCSSYEATKHYIDFSNFESILDNY